MGLDQHEAVLFQYPYRRPIAGLHRRGQLHQAQRPKAMRDHGCNRFRRQP
jgi:hypothetical protein